MISVRNKGKFTLEKVEVSLSQDDLVALACRDAKIDIGRVEEVSLEFDDESWPGGTVCIVKLKILETAKKEK